MTTNLHSILENEAQSHLEALRKANEARQRKKETRERIKVEDPNLYELISLFRNHLRLTVQLKRSAKKLEKFVETKLEVEL